MASSDQIALLFKARGDTDDAKKAFADLAQSMGLSEGTAKNLATALPFVGAAIAGVAAIATGAALAIWDLSKSTAAYGSAISDAQVKTGLGAKAISALKFAAEQGGSSFEAITGSVSKFNVLLGEAALGNEKAAATLKSFNITATDTDTALQQAIETIAKEEDATKKAAIAKALFKDRTGEVLLAIDAMGGDLEGAKKRVEELGIAMTDEGARAADEFDDTLQMLGGQAAGLGRIFALEMMPMMTGAMESISNWMIQNKGVAEQWGRTLTDIAYGTPVVYGQFVALMETQFLHLSFLFKKSGDDATSWAETIIKAVAMANPWLSLIAQVRQAGAANRPGEVVTVFGDEFSQTRMPGTIGSPSPSAGARGSRSRGSGGSVKREETPEEKARKEYEARVQSLRRQLAEYEAMSDRILAEWEFAAAAGIKTEQQLMETRIMLSEKVANEKLRHLERELKAAQELGQKTVDIENQIAIQKEKIRKGEFDNLTTRQKSVNDAREKYEKALKKYDDDEAKRQEKMRDWWAEQNTWHLKQLDQIEERIRKEHEEAGKKRAALARQKREDEAGFRVGVAAGAGMGGVPSIFSDENLGIIKTQAEFLKDVYKDIQSTAATSIGSMIQGLGQLALNWAMTGNFSAKAAMQMVAGILMSVAIESGIKAWFQYAEGTAALATTWGVPNPKSIAHFAAAKMYLKTAAIAGALGIGAGVASRAMGGESSGGFGSAGAGLSGNGQGQVGRGGSVFSSQKDQVVENGRNAPGGLGINSTITLRIQTRDSHIVDVVSDNVTRNGRLRTVIQEA